MASCCGDKTGLHCQDQKQMARSKSASSLTFAARASLPTRSRSRTFAILVVDLLVVFDKSNQSGIDLGCIDFTGAFHTLPVLEHEEGHLAFLFASCAALPPVPFCGGAFQQVSHVLVSQCSSPSSESKRMWTTPRACPFGHALAPQGSHGREPVVEERQTWQMY